MIEIAKFLAFASIMVSLTVLAWVLGWKLGELTYPFISQFL